MPRHYSRSDFFTKTGLPLCVQHVPAHEPIEMHDHDFTELVIVLGGSGFHVTQAEKHAISAGDVFVIHTGEKHAYTDSSGMALINILCDLAALSLPSKDMRQMSGFQALFALEPALRKRHNTKNHLKLEATVLAEVQRLALEIAFELKNKPAGFRAMATALFSQLILLVSRHYEKSSVPGATGLLQLSRAFGFIETHLGDKILLNDLAALANMSQSTFQRAFRRATGTAPIDYLLRFRISKASELLRDTNASIASAGFECGFEDNNYFSRMFRKVTGESPRQYRRRHKLKPITGASIR
jgi:AraC-like DNA-binding protein